MNTSHLLIGIIAICWGSGMIYYARAKNVPWIVKPFISTWWIESKTVNNFIAIIFGACSIIGGFLYVIGGLTGWKIMAYP
jgi:hypothetical protein